jgi:hemolysin activation/secretion protein
MRKTTCNLTKESLLMRWKKFSKTPFLFFSLISVALESFAAGAIPSPVTPAPVVPTAEQVGAITNFSDPGRAGNQLQKNIPFLPKVSGKAQVKHTEPQSTKASKLSFKLVKVIITGNTLFSNAELEKIFEPYLNKAISLGQLEDLVHQVTVKYRDSGHILSRAILPPQVIKGGVVNVRVVEGYVSGFTVKGDAGKSKKLLDAYGEHIMASKPLQIHDLQRYTLLANDLPGYNVESLLTPSNTIPAGADLTFITKYKRSSEFMSYDNLGTRFLGPLETTLGGSLYSLIAPGDSNNFRMTWTSRPEQLKYFEVTHAQPLGSRGWKWVLGADYTQTRPGFILQPLKIVGRNALGYTDVSYPWIRDRSKNFVTHAAFNYQNITSDILATPFYQDRIRSLVLGFSLDNIDDYRGINTLSFDATHGFNIWGASYHLNQSRPKASSRYTRLALSATRTQVLTQRYSVYFGMHSQYSFEPLLATEQFGVGGPDIGRGYDPSEIVGDQGVSAKLELRMDTYPGAKFLQSVQYYMFYDLGIILNRDSFDLPNQQSLTSVGGGARVVFFPQITGNFYVGKPLTRQVAVLTALNRNSTGSRVFFQLIYSV